MTTYRERRLRKAERLREWAEKREAKQATLNEAARADEAATGIPFGQPILVGHHSERRHRRAIERIDRAMGAAVENSRTADRHREKADNIEAAAERAIYSDDTDAVERLREKLATLEAKREEMKARNAAFRKERREELKGMTAWQRSEAAPHQRYELANLGGVISNTRKRIAQIERGATRAQTDRTITARYDGLCTSCGATITRGDTIRYSRADGARCAPECNGQEE